MKIKKNNRLITFLFIIIIILLLLVYSTKKEKIDYNNLTEEELAQVVNEEIKDMQTSKLSSMGERDRMEYYVSTFIKAIEEKNYESAYDMLYDEFKENYFPTLTSFEEYVSTTFPRMVSLEHTNFERNGDYYILFITMSSSLGSKNSGIEMNFVIKENDLNDFVLSFSVI